VTVGGVDDHFDAAKAGVVIGIDTVGRFRGRPVLPRAER
jgi:hypothetical protein